ncbi:DinB family protein [Allostreptomyces psammosilenae]|uniref:Putative damage-inducible protein DinB n=1 Tax=Allostreptomyces psammosilenae TaxID=1892865 RepID=A0A853A1K7_9ACTN|nr:DinB family protein [Allostreptomyces psammosilenae]NYI04402.1 putative damage-inducible protein DinB [Allostreptomyces psammosilenae]
MTETETIARVDPPYAAGERAMLTSWLGYHRATLALKCEGLTAAQLRIRAVEPSALSLLGLVRHMAEVERAWFRRVLAAEAAPPLYYSDTAPDGEFDEVDTADAEEAFATWRAECAHADRLVEAAESLEVTGLRHGEPVTLRWILVHMIEEYARHNGHADLLRERIDGRVGE